VHKPNRSGIDYCEPAYGRRRIPVAVWRHQGIELRHARARAAGAGLLYRDKDGVFEVYLVDVRERPRAGGRGTTAERLWHWNVEWLMKKTQQFLSKLKLPA